MVNHKVVNAGGGSGWLKRGSVRDHRRFRRGEGESRSKGGGR